jgi:hypothetical protein
MEPVEIYPILIKRDGEGWAAYCQVTGVRSWSKRKRSALSKVILANNRILVSMIKRGFVPPASSSFNFHWSRLLYEGVDLDIFAAILDAL